MNGYFNGAFFVIIFSFNTIVLESYRFYHPISLSSYVKQVDNKNLLILNSTPDTVPEDDMVIKVRKVYNIDEIHEIVKNNSKLEPSAAFRQLSGGYPDINTKENIYLYLWSSLIGRMG